MPLHPSPHPQGAGLLAGKHVGRAITAARRRASRQGQCPCTPDCPPWRAGLMWKMFRVCPHGRRSATGLAAGAVPLHPTPRPQGAGLLVGKHAGRAITAARRKASRLAGLVCLSRLLTVIRQSPHGVHPPAQRPISTADTACRSGQPNEKASVTQTSHWLFCARFSLGTRRKRAEDYMAHSA